jgi:hypothetical protein
MWCPMAIELCQEQERTHFFKNMEPNAKIYEALKVVVKVDPLHTVAMLRKYACYLQCIPY